MSQGGSRRPYSRGGPRWHPRYKEYWDYEQNYSDGSSAGSPKEACVAQSPPPPPAPCRAGQAAAAPPPFSPRSAAAQRRGARESRRGGHVCRVPTFAPCSTSSPQYGH
ncbi:unnamed protein product [Leptosia nina]|uniref:Uncharacterized protein n=1 Tax=Leptosia nina TaxID=320188 RepID=A0AAV1K6I7_9NEOP